MHGSLFSGLKESCAPAFRFHGLVSAGAGLNSVAGAAWDAGVVDISLVAAAAVVCAGCSNGWALLEGSLAVPPWN